MKRVDIINKVGSSFLNSNTENDEFNYPKAYKNANLSFNPIINNGRAYETLDICFVKNNISVLIETKKDFDKDKNSEKQLSAYVTYEKNLTGNKIIAILANTNDDKIKVWRGAISESNYLENETTLRTMEEYVDFYTHKINDKEKVMQNTYNLNETLHKYGISEKLRSQFVGTCLLALKNGLNYDSPNMSASQIISGIKEVLDNLLDKDNNKTIKVSLLDKNVLQSQDVRSLEVADLREILIKIENDILPFINDKSTAGQDLLNLFFITFNKYVGKDDKNQAFTPDHITDFMTKIAGVNKHSVILDPCCGSGSFLVKAMTQALDDCATAEEMKKVKSNQIYGIEYDESIYGLATTNMLIHSDGNSNIFQGSCFKYEKDIIKAKPNVILMNPPYNAQKKHMPKTYTKNWDTKKEDPSKGFYFVKYIIDTLNKAKIQTTVAVLLPIACAIGNNKEIKKIKKAILEENTLDAVFTLPNEIFHPGASASACCMIFKTAKKNSSSGSTFFGYYKKDGFKKKKKLGRIEQINPKNGKSEWEEIEKTWIELYNERKSVEGISVTKTVKGTDEWLCEAYMKTDYSNLKEDDFQETINDYLSFLVKGGKLYEAFKF